MTLPSVYSSISAHTHAVDFLMLHLQGEGFVMGFLRIRACRPPVRRLADWNQARHIKARCFNLASLLFL